MNLIERLKHRNRGKTHWEGCEKDHIDCEIIAELERLTTLTENDAKEIGSYREGTGLRGENKSLEAELQRKERRIERYEKAIPALREFLWMAVCYNDHNFRVSHVQDKCVKLCKDLGIKDVDGANDWLEALSEDN